MSESFHAIQHAFIENLRSNQANNPIDNVSQQRMQLYRQLVYNNIAGCLKPVFPTTKSLLNKTQWQTLVNGFIERQTMPSPYYCDISQLFVAFLTALPQDQLPYPFIAELAHYEWIELDLELQANLTQSNHPELIEANSQIHISPLTRLLTYQYPVHQISTDFLPAQPPDEPTFLVAYRNGDDQVTFQHLNALSMCLLEVIQQQPQTIDQLTATLSDLLQIDHSEAFYDNTYDICLNFLQKRILTIPQTDLESAE